MNDTEIISRLRDMADLYEQKKITVNQLADFMRATLRRIENREEFTVIHLCGSESPLIP